MNVSKLGIVGGVEGPSVCEAGRFGSRGLPSLRMRRTNAKTPIFGLSSFQRVNRNAIDARIHNPAGT
jgi:hypothetical protein